MEIVAAPSSRWPLAPGRGERVQWTATGLQCSECGARSGVTPDLGERSGRAFVAAQFNGCVNGTLCDRCRDWLESQIE